MRGKTWALVVGAGLLIGAVSIAQPPKSGDAPPKGSELLVTMLADAKTALSKTRDYTCIFTRQETHKGVLSVEQVAEMRVRANPVGVYVRFAKPEAVAGMEVVHSATRRNTKMRYRPAGVNGVKGFLSLELDDAKFLAENRYPVTDWTIGAIVERVATAVAREKTLNNPIEVYTSDFQFAGRNVVRYEILTRRPHALRAAHRMLLFVDKETKLPLRYEAYDQPRTGSAVGTLFEAYSFSDVKPNVGLGESSFDY